MDEHQKQQLCWYKLYSLPELHIGSFKRRQVFKYFAQMPIFASLFYATYAFNTPLVFGSLGALFLVRYYH